MTLDTGQTIPIFSQKQLPNFPPSSSLLHTSSSSIFFFFPAHTAAISHFCSFILLVSDGLVQALNGAVALSLSCSFLLLLSVAGGNTLVCRADMIPMGGFVWAFFLFCIAWHGIAWLARGRVGSGGVRAATLLRGGWDCRPRYMDGWMVLNRIGTGG